MLVGVAQRVDAAAIFLLIKFFALADLDHPLRAAALAPVEIPVGQPIVARRGAMTASVYLGHGLPPRDAERTRHHGEAVLVSIKGGPFEAHVETHRASRPTLWLPFHAFGAREPVLPVIVPVHEGDAVLVGEPHVFVFAQ